MTKKETDKYNGYGKSVIDNPEIIKIMQEHFLLLELHREFVERGKEKKVEEQNETI